MGSKEISSSLALLEKSVTLPGATVTRTTLVVTKAATDRQLAEIGMALSSMGGSIAFWLGDYGLALQERKGEEYQEGRAAILGIDEGYWRNCVMLCRFFKPSCRHEPPLGFEHHWAAMRAAGGAQGSLAEAGKWMKRAKENNWSVSKMREAVNKSLATCKPPELSPMENPFEMLDRADKWAHQVTGVDLQPETARQLLTRFSALVGYIEKLKELAK